MHCNNLINNCWRLTAVLWVLTCEHQEKSYIGKYKMCSSIVQWCSYKFSYVSYLMWFFFSNKSACFLLRRYFVLGNVVYGARFISMQLSSSLLHAVREFVVRLCPALTPLQSKTITSVYSKGYVLFELWGKETNEVHNVFGKLI